MALEGVAESPRESSLRPEKDRVRAALAWLPRPVRFLIVGSAGLLSDVGFFSILFAFGVHPLVSRAFSLALATVVTWRLNRHVTFARSGRHQADEALRYALVAVAAQGLGYVIFAALALSVFARFPQIAIVIGAVAVTLISYNGQRLVAFMPHRARAASQAQVSA